MIKKKCPFCKSKIHHDGINCLICDIDMTKSKKDLTKDDKKRRYFCRGIRVAALLAGLGGSY